MSLESSLANTNTNVANKTSKLTSNGDKKPGKLGGMIGNVSGIQKNVAGSVVGMGNIVAKAAGAFGGTLGKKLADALTGKTEVKYNPVNEIDSLEGKKGGLKSFYSQFSGISLNSIDRVDPLNTFECEFRFYPNIMGVQNVVKVNKKTSFGQESYDTGTDNITFIENESYSDETIREETISKVQKTKTKESVIGRLLQDIQFKNLLFSEWKRGVGEDENYDVKQYEAEDETEAQHLTGIGKVYNVFTSARRPMTQDLQVNLGIYIQKLTLPRLVVEGGEEVTTLVGKFPVPGNLVIPENNNLQMEVVNVESPIQENIFYPWMRETTLPIWSYDSQPFTTATITLDFTEHSNVKYHFFGCRPTDIQLIQPDQAPQQNPTRNVQFTFDFMTVETSDIRKTNRNGLPAVLSGGKKNGNSLTGLANAALFSATNTLKL